MLRASTWALAARMAVTILPAGVAGFLTDRVDWALAGCLAVEGFTIDFLETAMMVTSMSLFFVLRPEWKQTACQSCIGSGKACMALKMNRMLRLVEIRGDTVCEPGGDRWVKKEAPSGEKITCWTLAEPVPLCGRSWRERVLERDVPDSAAAWFAKDQAEAAVATQPSGMKRRWWKIDTLPSQCAPSFMQEMAVGRPVRNDSPGREIQGL